MMAAALTAAMFTMTQLLRGNRGEMPSRDEFMDAALSHLFAVERAATDLSQQDNVRLASLLGAFYEYTAMLKQK